MEFLLPATSCRDRIEKTQRGRILTADPVPPVRGRLSTDDDSDFQRKIKGNRAIDEPELPTVPLTFRVPHDLYMRLSAESRRTGKTRVALGSEVLMPYLEALPPAEFEALGDGRR